MASKKPLVLTDGQIEQLQSGDQLDAPIGTADVITMTNNNAGTIDLGEVVYVDSADGVDLAKADAVGTAKAIGLVYDSAGIAAAATGQIIRDGLITGLSGLTAGSIYYLSEATAGAMTVTPPSTGYVIELGVAKSTTEFLVAIKIVIKL